MKKGNVFRVKAISYEKLYFQLCKHNFKLNGAMPRLTIDELKMAQLSQSEDANLFEENGLFYQIEKVRNVEPTNDKAKPNVLEEIVFIDFKSQLRTFLEDHKNDIKYLFEHGFQVYKNDNFNELVYEFIPFEKSASMGKDSKISFISKIGYDGNNNKIEDFYNQIIKRSYLDLNEQIVDGVALAKRYAYRGLLLSTGKRIPVGYIRHFNILPKFEFSKETILIVQDMKALAKQNISYFTQEADEWNKDKTKLNFKPETKEKVTNNEFEKCINDGYGFIGNELAHSIDLILAGVDNEDENNKIEEHSSYQIRLPYVKGMVHRVDYQSFFASLADENGEVIIKTYDENLNDAEIKYTLQQLSKIQLIISESMFKVIKELKLYKKSHNEIGDALDFYFSKLREYKHTLFVLDTDKPNVNQENKTTWNYQYISTVDLNEEDFKNIFDYSIKLYEGIKKDPQKRIKYICSKDGIDNDDSIEENTAEEISDNPRLIDNDYSLEAKLLSLDIKDDLIHEPYFKDLLNKELDKMAQNFGIGRTLIKGQSRFIAGDPLKYMYYLACKEIPEKEKLEDNYFYIPGIVEDEEIKEGKSYPVLRNPHLCRNEDLVLKIHFPKSDSIRYKYLSNLTGTVIIDPTHSSIPAEALQGCDYDGDHAKIYFSDAYANAILKNRTNNNKDGFPIVINDEYKKKAPSDASNFIDNELNKYKVCMNTFSSSIGLISNLAFKESLTAYSKDISEEDAEKSKDKLRLLAILTGVEADSPKTGIKPEFNNICGYNNEYDDKRLFIDFKSILKNKNSKNYIKNIFDKKYKGEDKDVFTSLFNESKSDKFKEAFTAYAKRNPSNVEMLMQKYNELLKIRYVKKDQNVEMLPWAKPIALDIPDDSGLIYKGDKYNSVLSIINTYTRIVNEENYKLHLDKEQGCYYTELLIKAKWFDEDNGEVILNKLIGDLVNQKYEDFYSLTEHCTRSVLVYKYYPYFSNPYNNYEKSIACAHAWLSKLFSRYNIKCIDEEEYKFILSDAKILYQLIQNVKDRRYATFENIISDNTFDSIYKEFATRIIVSDSKEEKDANVNEYEDKLIKSIQDCKLFINNCVRGIVKDNNEPLINVYNNLVYDNYLMILIRSVFNCERLNTDMNQIIYDNVKKFITKINKKFNIKKEVIIGKEITNSICNILNSYLIKNLVAGWYNKEPSVELIASSNIYRLTGTNFIDKTQTEYYNNFNDYIQKKSTYWKVSLKEIVITELKEVLNPNNKHSEDQVEEEMIMYVRACQNEADKNQKFLMSVLGDIYYKVLLRKAGTNND